VHIKIEEGVRFGLLTTEIVMIVEAYWYACMREGIMGVVTGAQDRVYRIDGAHHDGRGLDLRSRDLHDPWGAADMIRKILTARGMRAAVLYGPPDHLDHIHVHYSPL
jgi:hypothetical protein